MGFIRVGQIVGAFGIKGQVKVKPMTDFVERFGVGRRLRGGDHWLTVENQLWHGQQLVLKFKEVADRTQAEQLQWTYLEASAAERPKLARDEFMTADLVGLKAIAEDGRELGVVDEILGTPAHDVFVIGDLLVPAVKEFVLKVDLEARTLTLRLLEGMDVSG